MQYKLFAVRVFVTDWQRAIRFYADTMGIPVAYRNGVRVSSGPAGHRRRSARSSSVSIRPIRGRKELVGRFVGVSLAVPDIFGTHKALTDRGVGFQRTACRSSLRGGVLAHLRAPDGNVITLLGDA